MQVVYKLRGSLKMAAPKLFVYKVMIQGEGLDSLMAKYACFADFAVQEKSCRRRMQLPVDRFDSLLSGLQPVVVLI